MLLYDGVVVGVKGEREHCIPNEYPFRFQPMLIELPNCDQKIKNTH